MSQCEALWPGNGYYRCDDLAGHDGPHGWNPDRVEWVDEAWVKAQSTKEREA